MTWNQYLQINIYQRTYRHYLCHWTGDQNQDLTGNLLSQVDSLPVRSNHSDTPVSTCALPCVRQKVFTTCWAYFVTDKYFFLHFWTQKTCEITSDTNVRKIKQPLHVALPGTGKLHTCWLHLPGEIINGPVGMSGSIEW